MIINSKLQDALKKIPQSIPPVWLMRQAGRYLPEYQKVRSRAGSFLNLCKNPDFACEVALQPIQRFDLDAAILFSDILTIPDALGLELEFSDGEGPVFKSEKKGVGEGRDPAIVNGDKSAEQKNNHQEIIEQRQNSTESAGFSRVRYGFS